MRRYAIAAVVLTFLAFGAYVVYTARLGVIQKCQRAIVGSIVEQLEEYRLKHGKYPERLSSLPSYPPDDGSPFVYELFHYEPKPRGFRLQTTYAASGEKLLIDHRDDGTE